MENYNILQDYYYYNEEETAQTLISLAGAPEDIKPSLIDALYHLKAIAENPYNSNYFRVFYNVLHEIADKAR